MEPTITITIRLSEFEHKSITERLGGLSEYALMPKDEPGDNPDTLSLVFATHPEVARRIDSHRQMLVKLAQNMAAEIVMDMISGSDTVRGYRKDEL